MSRALTCETTDVRPGGRLWTDWQDLMARVPGEHRVFGPEWFSVWNQTVGSEGRWGRRLEAIAARDESGTLQGVLPLAHQRLGPFRVFAAAGEWQPWRLVVASCGHEQAAGWAIGRHLARTGWAALRFGPYRHTSIAAQAVVEGAASAGAFTRLRSSLPLAIAELPATWAEYRERVIGRKMAQKIEYYERYAAKRGQVSIVHVRRPSAEETARLLEELALVEGRSWLPAAGGSLRFVPPTRRRMWEGIVSSALASRDQFDAWMMYLDGRPVSYCFTMTSLPARYVIANGYDEDVKDLRTGSTLYRYMVEDAIERGVRSLDFGDGGIHYKGTWGATYADTVDVSLIVPNRAAALAARLADRLALEARWAGAKRRLSHVRQARAQGRADAAHAPLAVAVPEEAPRS